MMLTIAAWAIVALLWYFSLLFCIEIVPTLKRIAKALEANRIDKLGEKIDRYTLKPTSI